MLYTVVTNNDEYAIQEICEKLNNLIYDMLSIKPNFVYIGSRKKGYYSIYNQDAYGKITNFNLNFRLYYPNKYSYSLNTEAKNLRKKALDNYIEAKHEESRLLYAKIEWFSVDPKGKGIGSKIIKSFIDILKDTYQIEFILLTPKTPSAKSFWIKNCFQEEDIYLSLDKRIHSQACKRLVYKI